MECAADPLILPGAGFGEETCPGSPASFPLCQAVVLPVLGRVSVTAQPEFQSQQGDLAGLGHAGWGGYAPLRDRVTAARMTTPSPLGAAIRS